MKTPTCDLAPLREVGSKVTVDSEMEPHVIDTPLLWFVRGTALGMLVMGSLNAVSYFFRSSSWGSLVGRPASNQESLGFPLKIWEAGNTYGGWFADYSMLAAVDAGASVEGQDSTWRCSARSSPGLRST